MSGNRGRARVSVRGRPSEISQGKCARSRVKRQIWAEQRGAEQSCELRSAKSSFLDCGYARPNRYNMARRQAVFSRKSASIGCSMNAVGPASLPSQLWPAFSIDATRERTMHPCFAVAILLICDCYYIPSSPPTSYFLPTVYPACAKVSPGGNGSGSGSGSGSVKGKLGKGK